MTHISISKGVQGGNSCENFFVNITEISAELPQRALCLKGKCLKLSGFQNVNVCALSGMS